MQIPPGENVFVGTLNTPRLHLLENVETLGPRADANANPLAKVEQREETQRPVRGNTRSSLQLPIPMELLSEIFLWHEHVNYMKPFLLSHVCASWRQLAFAMPRLWTHLELRTRHPANPPHPGCVELCNQWLERCRSHPVWLELMPIAFECWLPDSLDSDSTTVTSLLTLPPGTFPALERLALTTAKPLLTVPVVTSFAGTPLLRQLYLEIPPYDDPVNITNKFQIQWDMLDELKLAEYAHFYEDPAAAINFLVGPLRNIRDFTLVMGVWEVWSAEQLLFPARTILPNLRHLTVESLGGMLHDEIGTDEPFFRAIACPVLEELYLVHETAEPFASGILTDRDFWTTSMTRLRRLDIRAFVDTTCEELLRVLEHTPVLGELYIQQSLIMRPVFYHSLACPKTLLPCLHRLHVDAVEEEDCAGIRRGIEAMLRARLHSHVNGTGKQLEGLSIWSVHNHFDESWVEAMQALRPGPNTAFRFAGKSFK